jgi:3-oxoacyl-(acyl-carrier-protein) synthase
VDAFINGMGMVSPQRTIDDEFFFQEIVAPSSGGFHCIEPNYREYFNPVQARRFSKIIKMSLAAAQRSLMIAGVECPDAFITGTGLGCVEETENFLIDLIDRHEESLSPTPFILSTHNTIGSQIAVSLTCTGYNNTFAHRSFSFEHALLDCLLYLKENAKARVLVGGVDERTDRLDAIRNNLQAKQWTEGSPTTTAWGEGAAYFLVSQERTLSSYANIAGISTFHTARNDSFTIEKNINALMVEAGVLPSDVDLVLLGTDNGMKVDEAAATLMHSCFGHRRLVTYKDLCGEYCTSSSFAFWTAAKILREQRVPEHLLLDAIVHHPVKAILIYNPVQQSDHSLLLLRGC